MGIGRSKIRRQPTAEPIPSILAVGGMEGQGFFLSDGKGNRL